MEIGVDVNTLFEAIKRFAVQKFLNLIGGIKVIPYALSQLFMSICVQFSFPNGLSSNLGLVGGTFVIIIADPFVNRVYDLTDSQLSTDYIRKP